MNKVLLWLKRLWPFILVFFGSLVVFIIDFWVEKSDNATEFYSRWLAPTMDGSKIPLFGFILGLAVVGMLWRVYSEFKNEEIKELRTKMQRQIEMLIMAHEQLSPYMRREILMDLFQTFVTLHPFVLGVQLYEYTKQHLKGKTIIKLNLIDGYVQEQTDANAVHQTYFKLDIGLYREFQDVYKRSFKRIDSDEEAVVSGSNSPEGSVEVDDIPLIQFIQKYNHRLSVKPDLDQNDTMEYALVELGIKLLSEIVGMHVELFLDPTKKDKLLSLKKRTGFLQAILAEIPLTFEHDKSNEKADRQYVACPIHIDDKQYVYMILLDPEIRNEDEWLDEVDALTVDFESRLENCLKRGYTDNNSKKGEGNNGESISE
ncbi:hypothetical protein FE782_09115 [Paenibacillus antri]|uniref:Uncharacterized protein n=1 Tax=Paenibacillus antri TaxID=2582848 RepID=A0A5R9GIU4_9BACL|nr:hypothetical protein [Paenibacillus antri]TLS52773.1 hypothetical protein FE782_09115 [Paenibacillus antri]